MSATLSFRRNAFLTIPPVAGAVIRNKSGTGLLTVSKVVVRHRYGEPAGRDTISLHVEKTMDGSDVQPWPVMRKIQPPAPPVHVTAPSRSAGRAILVLTQGRKKRRAAIRVRHAHPDDVNSPVPQAQRDAVLAKDGTVFAEPKATGASWRDPDDSNVRSRTPRLARGYRRADPLERWARGNREVTAEHIAAADCYRLCWERGPGGGMPGGKDLNFCDRQFGAAAGISEIRCEMMSSWTWVQAKLSEEAKAILDSVVLSRMSVTAWALRLRMDRRRAVRRLIKALDKLLEIYADDVSDRLRQEGSPLEG